LASIAEKPVAEVVMRKLLWVALVVASVGLACKTGRSSADMADEVARLEKEAVELEGEYERVGEERRNLEAELERTRAIYENARTALTRRDELRVQLEALGYSPTDAGVYARATMPAGEGQARREPYVPESGRGNADGGERKTRPADRARGRYNGPHTIHVVKKGEYLFRIAGYNRYYGDGDQWPIIYEANAYQIKDPHWIFVGQRLQIPIR
jgi:nucleoid-associated protein YgaU